MAPYQTFAGSLWQTDLTRGALHVCRLVSPWWVMLGVNFCAFGSLMLPE